MLELMIFQQIVYSGNVGEITSCFTDSTSLTGSKRRMHELEDNFVDGSFAIPAHINTGTNEGGVSSEVECAEEKSDVADDTPQTTKKRRASNENVPGVALGTVDGNAPKKKSGKRKASQKKEEQPPTGTVLAYAEHDKSKEASKVAVVFTHVLMVADTVTRMEQKIKDVHERVEERLKVILTDVQRLSKQLEQHITSCEQGREGHTFHFNPAVVIHCCPHCQQQ